MALNQETLLLATWIPLLLETRGAPQNKFPTRPQLANHLLREETACTVRNRVMMLHDACTSGISRFSHSNIVAAVEDGDSYSSSLRMWSAVYDKVLNKQRRILSAGAVLLHDNARPHTARRSTYLLQEFSCEMFDHPAYSPDLAPSDFHLFLHLKKFLSGQRQHFQNDTEADMSVTQWLKSQEPNLYNTGI